MGASFLEDGGLGGVSAFEMKKQSEKHPPTHHPADYLKNKNGPGKTAKISVIKLSFLKRKREREILGKILKTT